MRKREAVIRAALTRYHAGQRLRILSYVNDALDQEGLRELDHEEADTVMVCWELEVLPYGEDRIPVPVSSGAEDGDADPTYGEDLIPVSVSSGAEDGELNPIDLDEWEPLDL